MIFTHLHKETWQRTKLSDVVRNINESEKTPFEKGISKFIGFEHITPEKLFLSNWGNLNDGVSFSKLFRKGQVLFGKIRSYLKKAAIASFDGICSSDILVFESKSATLLSSFLPFIIQHDSFFEYATAHSIGTTLPRAKWQFLANYQFLLPPLDEQRRIADMLYKIEDAIAQTEQQAQAVLAYRKGLINQLFQAQGSFGNLIRPEDCKRVKFGEVVKHIKVHVDPEQSGLERFVAGEHMQTDDLKIRSWGKIGEEYIGSAFTTKFTKGQVLYGSRRTYLRKVAVADFDGICANTTFILETKPEQFSQRLLPYLMLSESFTQHSIQNSKGSTNPYINWKDIAWFEFAIPDLTLQEKAATIFEKIDDVLEQTKRHTAALTAFKKGLLNELIG